MKAPNKIYIYTVNVGDNHYSITPTDNITDMKYEVEYIRKDALLEWTREQLAYYQKLEEEEGDPVRWGQRNAFQQVIDKINSL